MGDLEAPGMVGTDYPSTSYQAAVTPRFGSQRHRVMKILSEQEASTTAAIADQMGISRNQIATRVLELHHGGYLTFLYDDDDKVVKLPTSPGCDGRVHVLTPAGRSILKELG